MDEYLASTLNTAVFERLDYLDRLATKGDEPSRAALAETEIVRPTRGGRRWNCTLPTSTAAAQNARGGDARARVDRRPPASDCRRRFPLGRYRQAYSCRRTANRRSTEGLPRSTKPSFRDQYANPRKLQYHEGETVTVQMDHTVAPITSTTESEFDLDVTLLEVVDPAHLVNMTDDGCGQSCEKSTCISAA